MRRLVLVAAILVLGSCQPGPPAVKVNGETLVGKYVSGDQVWAFLGVPFAEPPVGDLRWRAPQPLISSGGPRDVTEFAPACMQTMRILDWYRYLAELFGGAADYYEDLEVSEDCLYLNVWTTTLDDDARKPVMVWIHGGSNKSGWSYEPNYHGHKLANEGVIVVSVGYRQGVFGFFSHPDMNPDEAVANFAYRDIIAALEWIQANIHEFGGDPDRVTLFGESAGAQNIIDLMFAKRASGLLHRAITQSTPRFGLSQSSSLAAERERAMGLAEALNLHDTSLEALRDVPAEELLEAYTNAFPSYYHVAAIDGQLFHKTAWSKSEVGDMPRIPLLIGTNDHEWYDSLPDDTDWDVVADRAASLESMDGEAALQLVQNEQDPQRALDRLITADRYVCKAQHLANRKNRLVGSTWVYHFTRVREDPAARNELGAYHGAEYPYVFGTHDSYMKTTATDLELEATMQSYWVTFAKTGNPNSEATPQWPLFVGDQPLVQDLGDTVKPKSAPEPELCALFEAWHAENYVPAN